jgi:hypothetical protein
LLIFRKSFLKRVVETEREVSEVYLLPQTARHAEPRVFWRFLFSP